MEQSKTATTDGQKVLADSQAKRQTAEQSSADLTAKLAKATQDLATARAAAKAADVKASAAEEKVAAVEKVTVQLKTQLSASSQEVQALKAKLAATATTPATRPSSSAIGLPAVGKSPVSRIAASVAALPLKPTFKTVVAPRASTAQINDDLDQ